MEEVDFVCIECGKGGQELYKEYHREIIKLTHCVHCREIVDKYVEYDPVLILLDILLFKPQAFRHLLCNITVQFHWKLCVVCLLCHAYMKWALTHQSDQGEQDGVTDVNESANLSKSFLYFALQIDFYWMFVQAVMDLVAYSAGLTIGIVIYAKVIHNEMNKRYDCQFDITFDGGWGITKTLTYPSVALAEGLPALMPVTSSLV